MTCRNGRFATAIAITTARSIRRRARTCRPRRPRNGRPATRERCATTFALRARVSGGGENSDQDRFRIPSPAFVGRRYVFASRANLSLHGDPGGGRRVPLSQGRKNRGGGRSG